MFIKAKSWQQGSINLKYNKISILNGTKGQNKQVHKICSSLILEHICWQDSHEEMASIYVSSSLLNRTYHVFQSFRLRKKYFVMIICSGKKAKHDSVIDNIQNNYLVVPTKTGRPCLNIYSTSRRTCSHFPRAVLNNILIEKYTLK